MIDSTYVFGIAADPALRGWVFDLRYMLEDVENPDGWEDAERLFRLPAPEQEQIVRDFAARAKVLCSPN